MCSTPPGGSILPGIHPAHQDLHGAVSPGGRFGFYGRLFAPQHAAPSRPGGREAWYNWYQALFHVAAALGAKGAGTHFGTLSVKDGADSLASKQRVSEAIQRWHDLAVYGLDLGLEYLFIETMSIPREMPSTIEGARALYLRLNENAAIPIRMCLDVGHAPPDEARPLSVAARAQSSAAMVHLQQSDGITAGTGHSLLNTMPWEKSNHTKCWKPFPPPVLRDASVFRSLPPRDLWQEPTRYSRAPRIGRLLEKALTGYQEVRL